jgi:protein-S-isoprenylcysteine O-methyltransferase Ste14
MMVRLGNFLFHYRNGLFPLMYVLLFVKSPPVFSDFRVAAVLGFLVAFAGQALRAITVGLEYIIRGGRKRQVYAEKLVQGGIFSHCRNPLYVGNFLILVGVGIASNSLYFLCIVVPVFFIIYWAIIAAEENYLFKKFGDEYTDYCKRVNRVIPNISGLGKTLEGMQFNWRRLITAEYGSAYIWMAAFVLLLLKNSWTNNQYGIDRPLVVGSWISLALLTIAYGVARYFKKSGKLKAEQSA